MSKDSVIDGELRSRLTKLRRTDDGEYVGEIVFDAGFRGFEGHFEGNPIVPGVCLVTPMVALSSAPVTLMTLPLFRWTLLGVSPFARVLPVILGLPETLIAP